MAKETQNLFLDLWTHTCNTRFSGFNSTQEKIDLMVTLGADVRPVPAVPFDDPMNYNHQVCIVPQMLSLLPNSPHCMIYLWWDTERENWSWSLLGVKGLNTVCSDESWLNYHFSLHHSIIFVLNGWENLHYELGIERVKLSNKNSTSSISVFPLSLKGSL